MRVYNTTKLTLIALATLLCSNLWAQVTADFTSDITTSCSVPATVNFTDLSSSPGVGIQQRIWSSGDGSVYANQTTLAHTYTQPGAYTIVLIVVDSLGARDTITRVAYIDLAGALSLTYNNTNTSCNGCADGTIALNVTGGTPQYTYLWGDGSTNDTLFNALDGPHNITVTDNNGCSIAETIILDSLCNHYFTSTIIPSCAGGSSGAIDIVLQGGNITPVTYSWSNGAITQNLTGLATGYYILTITDGSVCQERYYFFVDDAPAVQISTNVLQPISCNGEADGLIESTVTGGTPGYTYYWKDPNYCYGCPPSPPGPSEPDTFANAFAGMYILTVYDANGCGGVDTLILTEPAPVTVTATTVNNSCSTCTTGQITASASGGTPPYLFRINGAPFQVGNVFGNLPSGIYVVDVEDSHGCIGSIGGIVIDTACAHSTTLLSLTDVYCNGTPTGEISVTTTGGVAPYNYLWNNFAAGSTLSNVPAGTYVLSTTDMTGCSSLNTFMVLEPSAIVGTVFTNDVACFGGGDGSAQLLATGGTTPYYYSWSGRPTFSGFDTIQNLAPGTYSVTITDNLGCEEIVPFTIAQPAPLAVSTSVVDASCPTCADGSITANVTGGASPYTYDWFTAPPQTGQTAVLLATGSYSVTVTDNNGCTATGSGNVGVSCNLTVDLGNDTAVCFGVFNFNPTVAGGTGPYSYIWSTGETTGTIVTSNPGAYILTVTDINGCSETDTLVLSDANPAAGITDDTTICLGASLQLLATGGTSYDWTGGAVSNNFIADPTTTPTLTSLYFVEIDNGTCVSVRSVLVTVETNCVWPGDADNSGLVDNDDVLAIGIGYGDTGPLRPFASLVWEGQQSADWTNNLLSGSNYKYIDTDGNGTIDDDDTLAISLNYSLSHAKGQDERETTMPMIFIDLPDSVSAGQTVQGQLVLGSDSFPLANMYGIKFTMNYNTDFIEENTMSFSFGPSWMGTPGTDVLTFQKDLYGNGRIDGALTGINHVNRAGFGNIGMVNFTMKDDISGKDLLALPMVFDFTNIRAIDANEGLVDVEGGETTTIATQEVVGIGAIKSTLPVAIYPNPAQHVVFINTYGQPLAGIQLRNVLGETFDVPTSNDNSIYKLNTEGLAAGVYIITIQSQNHVAIERIVINK